MPIYQEFYNSFLRFGVGKPISDRCRAHVTDAMSGMYQLSRGLVARNVPVTWQARASFHLAFGIQPAVQEELENYYRNMMPVDDKCWLSPLASLQL